MRQVSTTALQAMLAQDSAEVMLPFVKIEHPSFASPIRLTVNAEAITRSDGDYMPYGFRINLPKQADDETPQMQMEVDNVDLAVNDAIRGITGAPTVTFDVALASSPDTPEAGPFVMDLQNATANAQSITGTLGYEQGLFDQEVPGQRYQPTNSPGLYR